MNDKKYISFHFIASVRCVLAKVRFFFGIFFDSWFSSLSFFFIPLFFILFHSASTFLEGVKKGRVGGGVAKTSRGKFHRNMICRHSKEEAPIITQLVKLKNVFIFPVHSLIPPLWWCVCASSNTTHHLPIPLSPFRRKTYAIVCYTRHSWGKHFSLLFLDFCGRFVTFFFYYYFFSAKFHFPLQWCIFILENSVIEGVHFINHWCKAFVVVSPIPNSR